MKKVAFTSYSFRICRICRVYVGHGPSSKVRAKTFSPGLTGTLWNTRLRAQSGISSVCNFRAGVGAAVGSGAATATSCTSIGTATLRCKDESLETTELAAIKTTKANVRIEHL